MPPKRYFTGLSATRKRKRMTEIKRFGSMSWKSPRAYVGFDTDKGVKVKTSNYTRKLRSILKKRYGITRSLSTHEKAKVTGVPERFLKESYNRGMAAWRTGHRPGATEQAWGHARVASFLTCGKTYETTDSDIARRAKQESKTARRWWNSVCKS
jgi:hypothetical protein